MNVSRARRIRYAAMRLMHRDLSGVSDALALLWRLALQIRRAARRFRPLPSDPRRHFAVAHWLHVIGDCASILLPLKDYSFLAEDVLWQLEIARAMFTRKG